MAHHQDGLGGQGGGEGQAAEGIGDLPAPVGLLGRAGGPGQVEGDPVEGEGGVHYLEISKQASFETYTVSFWVTKQ